MILQSILVTHIAWVNVQTNIGNSGAQSFNALVDPLQPLKFFRVRAF